MGDDLLCIFPDGTFSRESAAAQSAVVVMPWSVWAALPTEHRSTLRFQAQIYAGRISA